MLRISITLDRRVGTLFTELLDELSTIHNRGGHQGCNARNFAIINC